MVYFSDFDKLILCFYILLNFISFWVDKTVCQQTARQQQQQPKQQQQQTHWSLTWLRQINLTCRNKIKKKESLNVFTAGVDRRFTTLQKKVRLQKINTLDFCCCCCFCVLGETVINSLHTTFFPFQAVFPSPVFNPLQTEHANTYTLQTAAVWLLIEQKEEQNCELKREWMSEWRSQVC